MHGSARFDAAFGKKYDSGGSICHMLKGLLSVSSPQNKAKALKTGKQEGAKLFGERLLPHSPELQLILAWHLNFLCFIYESKNISKVIQISVGYGLKTYSAPLIVFTLDDDFN